MEYYNQILSWITQGWLCLRDNFDTRDNDRRNVEREEWVLGSDFNTFGYRFGVSEPLELQTSDKKTTTWAVFLLCFEQKRKYILLCKLQKLTELMKSSYFLDFKCELYIWGVTRMTLLIRYHQLKEVIHLAAILYSHLFFELYQ